MSRTLIAVAMAALLMLAGCASGVPNVTDDSQATTSGSDTAEMGTMNFYVSDEPNAMDDFEHLNVTITAVAFHKANASAEGDDDASDGDGSDAANTTDDGAETTTTEMDDANETTEVEPEDAGEVEDKAESDEWVVKEVDDQSVDLTKLKGENATLLSQFDIPAGEYDMAMVYVSEVDATLKTGEQVNVKLPSEKLQVKTPFTIGANESVDFVFDISVHKAGNSGKYILKPVVSESGTDVEKRVVDKQGKPVDDDEEAEYDIAVDGELDAGEEATVTVTTEDGEPVDGVPVEVNGEVVGETNADGQVTFTVPDAEELEIEVETESGEGELEIELGEEAEADDEGDDEQNADQPDVELAAVITSDVRAGEDATIEVTDGEGDAVEDAVVEVNGEVVGETNAEGELTFEVPSDEDELEVVVTKGDAEVELEHGVVAAASA